jgi:hypothetical protein
VTKSVVLCGWVGCVGGLLRGCDGDGRDTARTHTHCFSHSSPENLNISRVSGEIEIQQTLMSGIYFAIILRECNSCFSYHI